MGTGRVSSGFPTTKIKNNMATPLRFDMILPNGQPLRWDTPGARWGGTVEEVMAAINAQQQNKTMSSDNRISVTVTDQNVTDVLGHLDGIETVLNFLISRDPGDVAVMLGDKSVAFDEKCAGYIASNPEFLPGFIVPAEVLKDRAARAQFQKFLNRLNLLAAKANDTFNVIGNEIYTADLAYYNSTDEAARRGRPNAKDIHDDLATRYPGRPRKTAAAAKPA